MNPSGNGGLARIVRSYNLRDTSDGGLLRGFRARGDQDAFAELMHRHSGMVVNAAKAVVGDVAEAEDIAQAVFMTLARKAGSLDGADSIGGWLYHVAVCLARNARQKRQRREDREKEAAMITGPSDETATLSEAAIAALYEEIAGLSESYRGPVILHHLEGKSYEQAAAELRCNPNTFGARLTRAREKLRKRLVGRGVALGAAALAAALGQSASAAELSAAVVASTCKAAGMLAAGTAVTGGLVSANVTALMEGAMKMLFIAQVKTVAVVCAVALFVVAGAAVPIGLAVARAAGVTNEGAAPKAIRVATENENATPRSDIARLADKTRKKMEAIVIPEIDFQQASIQDVVKFLQEASVMFDTSGDDQVAKGVKIVLRPGEEDAPLITFSARHIALLEAIKIVTELFSLTYTITEEGIEVSRKTVVVEPKTTAKPGRGGVALGQSEKSPSQKEFILTPRTITNVTVRSWTNRISGLTVSGRSIADEIAKTGWTPVFDDPAGGEAAVERKRAADAGKIGAMSFSNENIAGIIHALSKRSGIAIHVDKDGVAGFEKEWTSDTGRIGDVVERKSASLNGEGDRIDVQIRRGRINLSTPESAKLAEALRAIIQHTARNHGPNSLCLVYGANEIAVTSLGKAFGRIATTEHISFDPALVEHGPVEDSQSPLADKRIYDVTLQGSTMQELLADLGTKCGVTVELDRMSLGKLAFSMKPASSGGSDALMTKIENGVVSCIAGKEGVRVVKFLADLCRDCGMVYVDAKPALYPYFLEDRVILTRPSKDVYVKLVEAYADGCPSEVQFSADGKTITIRSMPQVCRFAMQLAAGCRIASQEFQ